MFLISRNPSITEAYYSFEINKESVKDYFHPGAIAEKNLIHANLQEKVDQLEKQYSNLLAGKYKWSTYFTILLSKLKIALGIH
jgi:hypothetical protein